MIISFLVLITENIPVPIGAVRQTIVIPAVIDIIVIRIDAHIRVESRYQNELFLKMIIMKF
jgi:hypothetical protein